MSDNPGDEQRWIPSNEELPGSGTPKPEGVPGADEPATQWGTPQQQQRPPSGYPPPGGYESNGKATAALIIGILGLIVCQLLAPLALFFGYSARSEIDASGGRQGNRGLATAGIVLGWIGVGIIALILVIIIIAIIVGVASDSSSAAISLFSAR